VFVGRFTKQAAERRIGAQSGRLEVKAVYLRIYLTVYFQLYLW